VAQSTETVPAGAAMRSAGLPVARLRELSALASRAFPIVVVAALILMVALVALRSGGTTAAAEVRNGLTIGAVYALIAVGYTMVYGIIELINFAHGDVFTLSAFYALIFSQHLGFDISGLGASGAGGFFAALIILLVLTMAAAGLTGMLIERVAYRRLRNSPRLAPLITAVGVSFIIEGFLFATQGATNVRTGKANWLLGEAVKVGGVSISWRDIFVFFSALVFMFLLQSFVRFTRLGKAMRATAQDRDAALLSGVNINRTISATFFIGSALAAAGGIIYSVKDDLIVWNLGFRFGIIAFTCAVLGGIGNLVGAGLGAFLIGLIQVFGGQLIGSAWDNAIIFAMLIIVLVFRPVGLLGLRVPDRA